MVDIQNSLSAFLRNSLSGAQENASIATNAIVIPITRRSNLAIARNQIDVSFDRIEKSVKKLVDRNASVAKRKAQPKRRVLSPKRSAFGNVSGPSSNFTGTVIGSVIGLALAALPMVGQAFTALSEAYHGAVKWVSDRATDAGKAIKAGYGWLASKSHDVLTSVTTLAVHGFNATKEGISNIISYAGTKMESWSSSAASEIDAALTALGIEGDMPDAKIPPGAAAQALSAVKGFWNSLTSMISDWLNNFITFIKGGTPTENASGEATSATEDVTLPNGINIGAGPNAGGFATPEINGAAPSGLNVAPAAGSLPPVKSATTGSMMKYAMDQLRKEGVAEPNLRSAAALMVGQAQMESGLNPNLVHDQGTGFGIYGARNERMNRMFQWLQANGYAKNSAEGQMRYMVHEAMTDKNYAETRGLLSSATPDTLNQDTWAITKNFESPRIINNRTGAVQGAYQTGADADASASSSDGQFNYTPPAPVEPAPTKTPAASNSDASVSGDTDSHSTPDAYPDHGRHHMQPHTVNNDLGLLILGYHSYA